jgi:predicted DNA-binding WGR domain protein
VRRFELIEKNAAKFWAVAREREVLITHAGKIGSDGKMKKKVCKDFMAADQEYDRLIRSKLRAGYKEVEAATVEVAPLPDRTLEFVTLETDESFLIKPRAFRYIMWRMVEIGLIDRHKQAKDLSRWDMRAARRTGLDELPDPDHELYDEWERNWLRMTMRDRSASVGGVEVAGWKFLEGSHWIVTAEECRLIAQQMAGVTPKRHRTSPMQQGWLTDWVAFHRKAEGQGGYIVYADE